MPLTPNLIERTLYFTLNQGPGPILDLWSGPAFWSVHAALKLGLFEALAEGTRTEDQLAQLLGADPRGVRILLGVLESLGYVSRSDSQYRNTTATAKWLLDSGALNLSPFFLYWGALMQEFMPRLADSVRTGDDVGLYEWLEFHPEVSRNFQEAMAQIARFIADDIARALTVPPAAARLLDIGGGHGAYSITLCRSTPGLSAVILDSEQALVAGRRAIDEAGMSARIDVHEGDFLRGDLPSGFDVALLFNIVHGLSHDENIGLLRKVRAALKPGGQVAILEQTHNIAPLPLTNTVSHLLSLVYYHTVGGQVYTADEMQSWLNEAGFGGISRKKLLKAGSILLTATV
jgi:2-polyprenyl-3-methyl-5-hydroxy-6-metoxy-1,4-benzoquinol methylase